MRRTLSASALLLSILACGTQLQRGLPDSGEPDAGSIDAGPDAGSLEDGGVPALNILFIGDSYTYVNDLPGMLARIAATAGKPPTIATAQVVEGGARLIDLWDAGAPAKIAEGGWTQVVLQGQSLEPVARLVDSTDFQTYAQLFGDLVVDAGATPVFFVTWARAAANVFYSRWNGYFISPAEMQDELTSAYDEASRSVPTSILACAGEAFRRSLEQHPEIVLQQTDNSHPTLAGTYLAACTFYVALTGNPVPDQSEVPAGVSPTDAAALRDIARVGSDCADVTIKGIVQLRDRNGWVDDADGGSPFEYGTAGTAISSPFFLRNLGDTAVGLSDVTLSPAFSWMSGSYPGGSGTLVGLDGMTYPYCGSSVPGHSACALSITYPGLVDGDGVLSINLTGAYTTHAARALHATATQRARVTLRSSSDFFDCQGAICNSSNQPPTLAMRAIPGDTSPFTLVVSNVGGATAIGIVPDTALIDPFGWGVDGGVFPGGSGVLDGGSLAYCSADLNAGQQCLLTAHFSPTTPDSIFNSAIDIGYSDADGPLADSVWDLLGISTDDGGNTKTPPY